MVAIDVQIFGLGPMTAGLVLTPIVIFEAWMARRRAARSPALVCAAEVVRTARDPALASLARSLVGAAIVRFSSGPDTSGPLACAVRFRGARGWTAELDAGDQDLLFVTRSPTAEYQAAGTFAAPGYRGVSLRLVPAPSRTQARGRPLLADSQLQLELQDAGDGAWRPVCALQLRGVLDIDPSQLTMSAAHAGRGITVDGPLRRLQGMFHTVGQVLRRRARA